MYDALHKFCLLNVVGTATGKLEMGVVVCGVTGAQKYCQNYQLA
jgi:hypothetical protein